VPLKNKVIIVRGDPLYRNLFNEIGSVTENKRDLIATPEKVVLVLFTGGEDVHPYYYNGSDPRNICMSNFRRDFDEKNIFDYCRKYNVKMTGICRGFQFLNVMAGGFMYQHILNHGLGGSGEHPIYMSHVDTFMGVTSTHHQLVGLQGSARAIAWAEPRRSTVYIGKEGDKELAPEKEIEAAIFPECNAMGVQYHPEFMKSNSVARIHYLSMVEDFIEMNIDEFTQKYGGRLQNVRQRQSSGNN
jgi:gamma-glutamyl-gamma-aminobutyrate hydrolase PuuD